VTHTELIIVLREFILKKLNFLFFKKQRCYVIKTHMRSPFSVNKTCIKLLKRLSQENTFYFILKECCSNRLRKMHYLHLPWHFSRAPPLPTSMPCPRAMLKRLMRDPLPPPPTATSWQAMVTTFSPDWRHASPTVCPNNNASTPPRSRSPAHSSLPTLRPLLQTFLLECQYLVTSLLDQSMLVCTRCRLQLRPWPQWHVEGWSQGDVPQRVWQPKTASIRHQMLARSTRPVSTGTGSLQTQCPTHRGELTIYAWQGGNSLRLQVVVAIVKSRWL
jgi:hypothetical protein